MAAHGWMNCLRDNLCRDHDTDCRGWNAPVPPTEGELEIGPCFPFPAESVPAPCTMLRFLDCLNSSRAYNRREPRGPYAGQTSRKENRGDYPCGLGRPSSSTDSRL